MKKWMFISVLACGCAHTTGNKPTTSVEIYRGKPTALQCSATGPCKVVHNGVTFAEGNLEDGKPVGTWRLHDAKGRLREEGEYVGGLRQGTWKYYGVFVTGTGGHGIELTTRNHQMSETNAEGEYVDGVMNGPWVLTSPNGSTTYPFSGVVVADGSQDGFVKLQGLFLQLGPSGVKLAEGQYDGARPVGEWRTWASDGSLSSIRNPPNGPFVDFFSSGAKFRTGTLANSLLSWKGDYIEWHKELPLVRNHGEKRAVWRYANKEDINGAPITDLGQPCPEGTVVAGAIDGARVEQWCQQGEAAPTVQFQADLNQPTDGPKLGLACVFCGNSTSGSPKLAPKQGPFRSWSIKWGFIEEEGSFADGKRDGVWTSFDKEGVETVTTYRSGVKHGPYSVRRVNGELEVVGEYSKDKKHGEWTYYNANGQPERIEKWRNGELKE